MIAARLFAEKGFDGISMREISEQSQVSKPTIYYYFGSKENIYRDLLKKGLDLGAQKIEEISRLDVPAPEKLAAIFRTVFSLAKQNPDFARLYINVLTSQINPMFLQDMKDQTMRHRRMLVSIIRKGQESGELGPLVDKELAVEIIGGIMFHYLHRLIHAQEKRPVDQLAQDIVALLFRGLNE